MNLILSGRGVDLDEPLRQYATEKLTRIQRLFDRIIKMEVELAHERNRHGAHCVHVTVSTPRETLRAHGEGSDHFMAIDKAADRLENQVRRFKDRLRRHAHRDTKSAVAVEEPSAEAGLDHSLDDLSGVVRLRQQVSKPLTPEEASLELESRGLTFLLFTNAESMRASVLYRRGDGAFGLIEHEG